MLSLLLALAVAAGKDNLNGQAEVTGYIVSFGKGKPGGGSSTAVATALSALPAGSASVKHEFSNVIEGFSGTLTKEAKAMLEKMGATIEEDLPVYALANDDQDERQQGKGKYSVGILEALPWGLDRIDQTNLPLDGSFETPGLGEDAHVFVVDTGINLGHNEWTGRIGDGYDFIDNDDDPTDCGGHGTHCAGTVLGTHYGVAKGATLHGVRVLGCSGSGSTSGIIAALEWVAEREESIKIVSMSLGGGFSSTFNDAVNNLVNAGVTTVVAAGNDNDDACTTSPASAPLAITVGSTTSSDARSGFSNYGSCVDIYAPGSSILSAWIGGPDATNTISGTSMACPHVAGVVAQWASALGASATPAQLLSFILAEAVPDIVTGVPAPEEPKLLQAYTMAPPSPPPAPPSPPPSPPPPSLPPSPPSPPSPPPLPPSPPSPPPSPACISGHIRCGTPRTGTTAGAPNNWGNPSGEVFFGIDGWGSALRLDTCGSSYDTYLRVYDKCPEVGGVQLAANDDGSCGFASLITLDVPLDSGYVVMVEGYSSSEGAYTLAMTGCDNPSLPLPPSLPPNPPTSLTSPPAPPPSPPPPSPPSPPPAPPRPPCTVGTITCAAPATGSTAGAPNNWGNPSGEHLYAISGHGTLRLDTCGSSYDTYLRVYDKCPDEGGVQLAANDDGSCGLASLITLDVPLDSGYVVMVEGYSSSEGAYTLAMTGCEVPSPSPSPGPLPTPPPTPPPSPSPTPSPMPSPSPPPSPPPPSSPPPLSPSPPPSPPPPPPEPCAVGRLTCATPAIGSTIGLPSVWGAPSGDALYRLSFGEAGGTARLTACGSDFDTVLRVLDGCPGAPHGATELAVNDDSGECGDASALTVDVPPGGSVIVLVEGFVTKEGQYKLTVEGCPDEDEGRIAPPSPPPSPSPPPAPCVPAGALPLSCGTTVRGDTRDGSGDANFGNPAREHYYTISAPTATTVTLDTCGSEYDTFLRVYDGCPRDADAQIGSDDDSGCGVMARLSLELEGGVEYLVLLEGFGANQGPYSLEMSCDGGGESSVPDDNGGGDELPGVEPPTDAARIHCSLGLEADLADWADGAAGAADKRAALGASIAQVAEVPTSDVLITSVVGGSVTVHFEVVRADEDEQIDKVIENLETRAAQLAASVEASTGSSVTSGVVVQEVVHPLQPTPTPTPASGDEAVGVVVDGVKANDDGAGADGGDDDDDDDNDDDDLGSQARVGGAAGAADTATGGGVGGSSLSLAALIGIVTGAVGALVVALCAYAGWKRWKYDSKLTHSARAVSYQAAGDQALPTADESAPSAARPAAEFQEFHAVALNAAPQPSTSAAGLWTTVVATASSWFSPSSSQTAAPARESVADVDELGPPRRASRTMAARPPAPGAGSANMA